MYYDTKDQFLLNCGWKHYWCDPDALKNFYLKEVVKGPFAKPKFVNSVPYVTLCQQDGSAIRLSEGIPDPWSEYLIQSLRLYQNYVSMHKEDLDIVPQLRKHYRLYIGQGIPSPWIDHFENFSTLENPRRRVNRLPNSKKYINYSKQEHCNCCSRKYLFKCPDSCVTNSSSSSTNRNVKNNCSKKCSYINRISKNLKKKKPTKESLVSSSRESSFGADDEGENLNEENQPHYQRNKYFKQPGRGCCCPYIRNFHLKKLATKNKNDSTDHGALKTQQNHSKLIQAKLLPFMSSKSVQTELPKVERCTQCYWCNIVPCNSPWGASCKKGNPARGCEIRCPTIYPVTSFCFPTSCAQNSAFVCPYSVSNHIMPCKPHKEKSREFKKQLVKKKQHRESIDDLNPECMFNPAQQNEASERKFNWVNTKREMVKPSYDFFQNKSIYSSSTLMKPFDHIKYLTDSKLKCYLQREDSFLKTQNNKSIQHSSFSGTNFDNENTSANYPSRVQLERFKSFCHSTPEQFKPVYEERKISPRERNG